MKILEKAYKTMLIVALLFLILLLLLKNCATKQQFLDFQEKAALKFEENNARLIDAENRVFRGDLVIVEQNDYINSLIDSIKHLQKPKIITRVVLETRVDTVFVPFDSPIVIEKDSRFFIAVPQNFNKKEEWHSVSGIVTSSGINFNNISFKNDFVISTGTEDHGSRFKNLIKPNKQVVQIRDNNPYSMTLTLQQIVIKEPRRYFTIVAGGGYGTRGADVGIYGGFPLISF